MPPAKTATEKQLERIEKRIKNRPEIKFTPEMVAKLNKLEAQLQAKARGNKNLEIAFGETKSFFTELNDLSPADRTAKLKSIRLAAEDEFADFFQKKRENLGEDVATEIERLNRDVKFADEDTMAAFKNKISTLDRDTAEAIGESFRDIAARGLGSSGAMKAMADKIIRQRTIVADQIKEIKEVSLRDLGTKESDIRQDIATAEERGIEKIGTEELFTTKLEERRLLGRESDIFSQTSDITGQNTLAPRAIEVEPDINPTDPISVRLNALRTNETETTSGANIQNRTQERRNNRISRRNLIANAN